jgi:fructokinase
MVVRIIAIGDAIMDVVVQNGVRGSAHPGGSPLNIAYGLARLGRPVSLLSSFGNDRFGKTMEARLIGAGVSILPESYRDESTSSSTAYLDDDGSATYQFDFRWSLPAGLELPPADIIHVGSVSVFVEPGGASVADLVRRVGTDSIVVFDPNIRPSLCGTLDVALVRFEEIARESVVVKLSEEDAAWLFPGLSLQGVLARILELGPTLVVITRGSEGALLSTLRSQAQVIARKVKVVDTIGAGDSFTAALIDRIAALIDGKASANEIRQGTVFTSELLETIGKFAVSCASLTVSRAGANPPTLAEIVG